MIRQKTSRRSCLTLSNEFIDWPWRRSSLKKQFMGLSSYTLQLSILQSILLSDWRADYGGTYLESRIWQIEAWGLRIWSQLVLHNKTVFSHKCACVCREKKTKRQRHTERMKNKKCRLRKTHARNTSDKGLLSKI